MNIFCVFIENIYIVNINSIYKKFVVVWLLYFWLINGLFFFFRVLFDDNNCVVYILNYIFIDFLFIYCVLMGVVGYLNFDLVIVLIFIWCILNVLLIFYNFFVIWNILK